MAIRVHELAKELGVPAKDVIARLADLGIWVKSASSTVPPPVAHKIRGAHEGSTAASRAPAPRTEATRVFELARELGTSSKVVLAILQAQGEYIRSASSELSTVQMTLVRERIREARESGDGAESTNTESSPSAITGSRITPLSLPRPAPPPPAATPPQAPPSARRAAAPVSRHSIGEHFWSGKGDAGYPVRPEDLEPAGPPSRMLAYRSLVTLRQPGEEVGPRLEDLILGWVRRKNLPVDGLVGTIRSPDGRLALTSVQHQHDGRVVGARYRLVDARDAGTWIVTITVGMQSTDWTYLLTDVESSPDPNPGRDGNYRAMLAAPPGFVQTLISDFSALDSDTQVTVAPTVIDADDVDWLISAIKDPERRGLMTIAGPAAADSAWISTVRQLHRFSVGLVSPYLLTAEALALFCATVPPQLSIEARGLRTFHPGTDFDSLASLRRNRGFLASTIASEPPKKLARILGYQARDTQVQRPLPSYIRQAQAHLDRLERDAPLRPLRPAVSPNARPSVPTLVTSTPPPLPNPTAPPVAASSEIELAFGLMDRLLDIVELLGAERSLTPAAVEKIEDAVLASQVTPWTVEDLRQQLESVQTTSDTYQSELYALRGDFEDAQLEHLEDLERFEVDRARLLHLEKQMHRLGQAQVVADSYLVEVSSPPSTFEELVARLHSLDAQLGDAELALVVFTGDPSPTLELDELDPSGAWASKAWEALRALNDYAHLKADREFDGSFETYCQNTPPGSMEWPANQHVMSEGEQVNTNPVYRQPRVLPVPVEIDASCRAFMEAHMRISRRRSVAPRLHYLDATMKTGVIYVGYIGRHLPNTLTN